MTVTKRCPAPLHEGERDLPLEAFSRHKGRKFDRKSWCRNCIGAQQKQNSAHYREYKKAYRQKNLARIKAKSRAHYLANADYYKRKTLEWQRQNPERSRQKGRDWFARNRDRANEMRRIAERGRREYKRAALVLYRAHKKAAGGNLTKEKLVARWAFFGGKCWMCGKEATDADHVKPVSLGGGSWASNIRPACSFCNNSRGNKWPLSEDLLREPFRREGGTVELILG